MGKDMNIPIYEAYALIKPFLYASLCPACAGHII